MVIRQMDQYISRRLWCCRPPLPLNQSLHIATQKTPVHTLFPWIWVHSIRVSGYTSEANVTKKGPLSRSSLRPFSSLPSRTWNPWTALFPAEVRRLSSYAKDQQCGSTNLKIHSMFSLNCWGKTSAVTAGSVCAGLSVTLNISHACVCYTEYCSERSAANPDTWVKSGHPEGITNRWLLVPLIPYTVKQALLENSHPNIKSMEAWKQVSPTLWPQISPSSPPTSHPSSCLTYNSWQNCCLNALPDFYKISAQCSFLL